MKIVFNQKKFYQLMNERNIETIAQLCRELDIDYSCIYNCIGKGKRASKETYWRLAKFFGCHVEDLQIADESL